MKIENLNYTDISKEIVDNVLFEGIDYSGEKADVCIVLGSSKATKYRVPMACKLYNEGKIGKIICCGGKKFSDNGTDLESLAMKKKAISLGVDENDIEVESESKDTMENILNGAKFLEEYKKSKHIKKVILITTTFHMKRSMLLAKKYFPKDVEIIPCPADDLLTKRDTWYKNQEGYERAVGEIIGIKEYAKNNIIDSFEIF